MPPAFRHRLTSRVMNLWPSSPAHLCPRHCILLKDFRHYPPASPIRRGRRSPPAESAGTRRARQKEPARNRLLWKRCPTLPPFFRLSKNGKSA
jgi:hypothetical protein